MVGHWCEDCRSKCSVEHTLVPLVPSSLGVVGGDGQCEDDNHSKEEGGKRIVAKKGSGESDGSRSKYDMGKEEQGHKEDCCQWCILDQTFFPALDPPFSHAFGDREQTGKDADELKASGSRIF